MKSGDARILEAIGELHSKVRTEVTKMMKQMNRVRPGKMKLNMPFMG